MNSCREGACIDFAKGHFVGAVESGHTAIYASAARPEDYGMAIFLEVLESGDKLEVWLAYFWITVGDERSVEIYADYERAVELLRESEYMGDQFVASAADKSGNHSIRVSEFGSHWRGSPLRAGIWINLAGREVSWLMIRRPSPGASGPGFSGATANMRFPEIFVPRLSRWVSPHSEMKRLSSSLSMVSRL